MKKQSISANELAEEITVLIKEEFVAKYEKIENALQIHFSNGQSFLLKITEL